MRRRTVAAALAVLAGVAACSSEPEDLSAGGVPARWYGTVDEELAARPEVGRVGMLESGGPCPLRDEVVLDGKKVSKVSDHGVVRLGGDIPAVLCSWYEDIPVEVTVAHAPDAERYAELVAGTRAVDQPGNDQTEREVTVDGRTVHVVRIVYPTNPSAGFTLTAAVLDEGSRGRVTLEVSVADRIEGYDEEAVAADLVAFRTG